MGPLPIAAGLVATLALGVAAGWFLRGEAARRKNNRRKPLPEVESPDSASFSLDDFPALGSISIPGIPRESLTRSGLYAGHFGRGGVSSGEEVGTSTVELARPGLVARVEAGSLKWRTATPELLDYLGVDAGSLRDRSFLDSFDPADRGDAGAAFDEAAEAGEAHGVVCRVATPAGRKTAELHIGARYAPDGKVAYLRCRLTDLTDRVEATQQRRKKARELERGNEELRRANRALAALKDRYTDLYQNAPAMHFSVDPAGKIVACNDTMLRALGRSRDELVGRPYVELLEPDDRPAFEERFRRFVREGEAEGETRWRTADGRLLDVLVKATAVRDHAGKMLRSRSVAQDITELKRLETELRRNNDRLARANAELSARNRELDEFAYVVSHDLQEPVRTLVAFSDFLKADCAAQLDERGLEYVRLLGEAARRMRALIRDLLELSKAGKAVDDFGPVELGCVMGEVRDDLSELIRARGGEVAVAADLPVVWGDRRRIGQLLANLVGNGLKYNRAAAPRVEVGLGGGDGRAGSVVVRVADNGIGIDPRHHDRIFHLFRRLHPREEYEGTGAGLAICQKIAEAHGGRIWVESRPGEGSAFLVELPLPPAPIAPPTEAG